MVMRRVAISVAVVAALALAGACSGSPVAPTPVAKAPQTAAPATTVHPTTPAPPAGTPSRTFGSAAPLSYPLSAYTLGSQFVLYDNGTFALQYPNIPEYRGTYTETDGTITFNWDGWSVAGPWAATGTLSGNQLTVRYNLIMELTDFENAVYTRMPGR